MSNPSGSLTWVEREHPVWGAGGSEEHIHERPTLKEMFPHKQFTAQEAKYSIIPPCGLTWNLWEMYDGQETALYNTLEDAKAAAQKHYDEHKDTPTLEEGSDDL